MEESSALKAPEQPDETKQDAAAEKQFIKQYTELSGASESQARSVYMYADIIRQRDPYCYRFE
ncbi:MAG: hypothetical protein ACLQVY_30665 [Limisphaerales bacterium]